MMTTKEKNETVLAYMDLIASTARKTALACGQRLPEDAARDLVQDAVLVLLASKLDRFDASEARNPGGMLTRFIATCVRNHVIDTFRTTHYTSAYDTAESGDDGEGRAEYVAPSSDNPERNVIRADNARALRAMLTAGEWSDLGTFMAPDYSEEDYAARNAVTVNAARARKSRLLSKVASLTE